MVVKTNRGMPSEPKVEPKSERKESEYMLEAKRKAVHFEIESESSEDSE
jgi:hypothetical protein